MGEVNECKGAGERAGTAECKCDSLRQTRCYVDDSEKLCRLVSEFGRVWERRKFRVDVGKSKVIRCSRYRNCGRMPVRLNGELLAKWIDSSTSGRKWQQMEVVKGMWHTE